MKTRRQSANLDAIQRQPIRSQEQLRRAIRAAGFQVTQATLSRDIRELGLAKIPNASGTPVYTAPPDVVDPTPRLARLLPPLYIGADGVGNLLIVKTVTGGAQPIAVAIDYEEWEEIVGTVAGDDTILLVLRDAAHLPEIRHRLKQIAGVGDD